MINTKPKMVYICGKLSDLLDYFKDAYYDQAIEWLSEYFTLVTIDHDCDYFDICMRYKPDIVCIEGPEKYLHRPPVVLNKQAFPEIPKIALFYSDTFSAYRTAFLADMEEWNVNAYFSVGAPAGLSMPEIKEKLFVNPWFIDFKRYDDLHLPKVISILLTGFNHSAYPWRVKTFKEISANFQAVVLPHTGYYRKSSDGFAQSVVKGERFARIINASKIVPTCGTASKIVVRKHLEIPACGACLVTEDTPAIKEFGFVDMENCVFADEKNICDKLEYLLTHDEELVRITRNGYQLVRTMHTIGQRRQLLQWYLLNKKLLHNQKIIQRHWFADLEIVSGDSSETNYYPYYEGLDLKAIRNGDELMAAQKYEEAITSYQQCFQYRPEMPESMLRIAICHLFMSRPGEAYKYLSSSIGYQINKENSIPDPIEWSYLLICLICMGDKTQALNLLERFPRMNRRELTWAKWFVYMTCGNSDAADQIMTQMEHSQYRERKSIHVGLPINSFQEAVDGFRRMVDRCKQ